MKHKFIKQMILTCLVVFTLALPCSATIVKVGYLADYGIVDDLTSIDNKGYGYEVLEATKKYSNLTYEYVPVAENAVLSSLNAGIIDLFGPMPYTEARGMQYSFSRSFGMQQIMLVAPNTSSYLYNDTASFNGQSVTSLTSMGFDSYLYAYNKQYGITTTVAPVATVTDFYASANPLTLTSSLMDLSGKQVVANLGIEQLYFVARVGNTALINSVNAAINALEISDPLFMTDAHRKYFENHSVSKPVSVTENALLTAKPTFTVGYLSNHFPAEGLDSKGMPEGIMVDLMNMIAADAGIKLTYSPYSIDSGASHSSYDLNIALVGIEDFNQYYTATNSFSNNSTLTLLAKEGSSISSLTNLGILPFVTFDMDILHAAFPGKQFTTFNTYAELAKALEKEEVQGALLSSLTSDYVHSLVGDDDYAVSNTQVAFPIRIFVNKALGDQYVDLFNTLISRLDETEVQTAFLSQISKYRADPTLLEIIFTYWYIYLIGILIITGGFFSLFLYLQRRKQQAVLDALNVDEITGLASEIKFISDVETVLKTAENDKYMIVTFDVDHFSLIRKQYGYDRSNDVLAKIGEILMQSFPDDCFISRSKADLFLIFTKQNIPGRAICGKHICDECVIDCAKDLLASTHPLSVSEGVYRIHDTSMPVQLMIDYCNMARLQGKSVYGLTVNEYTKELDAQRELNNSIVLRMERALLGKELIPYYQPKVHLKTSMVTGCEALVRWCDIDSDLETPRVKYMPDEFIPLFEENGFIAKLDYHIFDEICAFIRRNMKDVGLIPKISINLSGVTLLKNDLRGSLVDALERYRVLPKDIDLEITESAFTQYPKESASKVRMLRNEGFTISMDDFGTGASSLNRLKDMDITTIKLDKAFLDYNLAELKGSVIIGNMINMARRLGLEVVAEGVETKEQLSALKMLHCDLVQGYYYSKPVNEDDFMEMLQEPVCLSDVERIKRRKEAEAAADPANQDRGELVQ